MLVGGFDGGEGKVRVSDVGSGRYDAYRRAILSECRRPRGGAVPQKRADSTPRAESGGEGGRLRRHPRRGRRGADVGVFSMIMTTIMTTMMTMMMMMMICAPPRVKR